MSAITMDVTKARDEISGGIYADGERDVNAVHVALKATDALCTEILRLRQQLDAVRAQEARLRAALHDARDTLLIFTNLRDHIDSMLIIDAALTCPEVPHD